MPHSAARETKMATKTIAELKAAGSWQSRAETFVKELGLALGVAFAKDAPKIYQTGLGYSSEVSGSTFGTDALPVVRSVALRIWAEPNRHGRVEWSIWTGMTSNEVKQDHRQIVEGKNDDMIRTAAIIRGAADGWVAKTTAAEAAKLAAEAVKAALPRAEVSGQVFFVSNDNPHQPIVNIRLNGLTPEQARKVADALRGVL